MNQDKNHNSERPEAYPKPTETDKQLDNQPEFIEPQPDKFDKSSDVIRDNKGQPSKEKEE